MLIPGLVSITFRQLSPEEIIKLVVEANLKTIEWGGDIHVPHGDTERAQQVAQWTKDAGLTVAAYGSYYRIATGEISFSTVLDTTLALGAPTVRVWAGKKSSEETDDIYRQQVAEEAREIAEASAKHNITVSLEYHDNTLTDTEASAIQLMKTVNHDNLKLYWQPPHRISDEARLSSLQSALPYLTNVHVFQWHRDHPKVRERYLLEHGKADWQPFLERLKTSGRDHATMIEFVRDDEPRNFKLDATTLLSWLESYSHMKTD